MENSLGVWTTIELAGHPCDVYEPPTARREGMAAIYLHGVHLNRLVDNAAFTAEFARHGLPVIAPMTQRSWWTNRVCPEFDPHLTAERHLLDNVLPYVRERWRAAPPRIGLLGTSMGGQGALRFAFKYPERFPVAAALSPAIDYHRRLQRGDEPLETMYEDVESARQDTATLHVHALNWPRNLFFCVDPTDADWFESSDRLHMKLKSLGIPHEVELETVGGGHGFGYYNLLAPRAIAFLVDRLEKESRRFA